METVIKRLQEIGGGGVYAIGGEVVAEFPAPLCGLLSLKPMETVRDEIKGLEESLKKERSEMGEKCPHRRYPQNSRHSPPKNYPPRIREVERQEGIFPLECRI